MADEDSTPIELLPNPNDKSTISASNEEVSLLNVACTDFNDFDTQMSPLIYSDSDDSIQSDSETRYNIQRSQNLFSPISTPDIACNQEQAARARYSTKEPIPSTSNAHVTPTKRKYKKFCEKTSPIKLRSNYQPLSVKIHSKSGDKSDSRLKTYLFRTRKQTSDSSTNLDDAASLSSPKPKRRPVYNRCTSSTSDVQILSEQASVITISSTEDQSQRLNENRKETEFNSETNCSSPDLFNSFTSVKSEPRSQIKCNAPNSQDKPHNNSEVDTFRNVFGPPDECDDIDLLSSRNVDIFEITKNNVFDNVLCSANDRITPFKSNPIQNPNPNTSCLSGLRVMLPKFDGHKISEIQNEILSHLQSSQKQMSTEDSVVDLTLNSTQNLIVEVSSDDSNRNREQTPERKQDLTPSTRSCLKPNSSVEKKKRSSRLRHGWLTTSRVSPQSTPQSRRRLDKWRRRMNDLQPDDDAKVTKPRNLFNEFKSTTPKLSQRLRKRNFPSTSAHESPNIFSDHD